MRITAAFSAALLAICCLAACQTPAPEAVEPTREEPAAAPERAPRIGAFAVAVSVGTELDGRQHAAEFEARAEIALGFETPTLTVLALDDPIGRANFELSGDDIVVVVDGTRAALDPSTPTDDSDDGCVALRVRSTWPDADVLSATERTDVFTLCDGRGLVGRERVTTMPAGRRRVAWVAE